MDRPPKFPVLLAVTRSYEIVFQGLGPLLRAAWPWALAAMSPFLVIWALVQFQLAYLSGVNAFEIALAIGFALFLAAVAGCANAWHRVLLADAQGDKEPSWASASAAYVLRAAALLIVALAPPIILLVGTEGLLLIAFLPYTGWIAFIAPFLITGLAAARMALVLPSASIGNGTVTFRSAWATTGGNSWRILSGGLLVLMPPIVLFVLMLNILQRTFWTAGDFAVLLNATFVAGSWTIIAGLGATYLSLAYRFFIEHQPTLEANTIEALAEQFK